MRSETVDVILPAGGRLEGAVKALHAIDGDHRSVLARTIDVVRASVDGRIAVIGPDAVRDHADAADAVLDEGATGPENIFRGLDWLQTHPDAAERVLIVTTDLPFLTADALTAFVRACPDHGDICLPVIARDAFETRFPGSPNEYVQLRDGHWTLGCAFLVRPAALRTARASLDRVFAARKSQIGMARLLGPVFIARFLAKRLAVPHIEARCGQILGCRGVAVRGGDPALAFDIDEPEHLEYARRWVAG